MSQVDENIDIILNNESGAFAFRDSEEKNLTLMIYSKILDSLEYDVLFFKNNKTYTAKTDLTGFKNLFNNENLFSLKKYSFTDLKEKIYNYKESDYDNMMKVVNSKIDISYLKTNQE